MLMLNPVHSGGAGVDAPQDRHGAPHPYPLKSKKTKVPAQVPSNKDAKVFLLLDLPWLLQPGVELYSLLELRAIKAKLVIVHRAQQSWGARRPQGPLHAPKCSTGETQM